MVVRFNLEFGWETAPSDDILTSFDKPHLLPMISKSTLHQLERKGRCGVCVVEKMEGCG